MLTCEKISCVRGGRLLFENLSFALNDGDAVIVRGSNGTGKTSLLRVVTGLLSCTEGRVKWAGQNISGFDDYHSNICYVGHKNALKNQQTVSENLEFWNSVYGNGIDLPSILEKTGLPEISETPCHILSAGWQRRVALTRALISKSSLWIIDEPLSYLDSAAKDLIIKIIEEHLNAGGMALLADHGNEYDFGEELHISSFARGDGI